MGKLPGSKSIPGVDTALSIVNATRPIGQAFGAWVADNSSTGSAVGDAIKTGYREACKVFANAPQNVKDASWYGEVCNRYLDNGKPSWRDPGFQGGQCPVQYNATYRILSNQGNSPPSGFDSSGFIGPLRSASLVVVGTLYWLRLVSASGTQDVRAMGVNGPDGNPRTGVRFELSLARADGQPDNCGSLSPWVRSPTRPTPPSLPPGGGYLPTLPPANGFPPIRIWISPESGKPYICVDDICIPFFPTDASDDDGEDDWSPPPTIPGTPVELEGGEDGIDEDSDAPLFALKVEVLDTWQGCRREQGVPVELSYSSGWVGFKFDGFSSVEERRICHPNQLYFAPIGATGYQVKISKHHRAIVTPIYVDVSD